MALNLVTMIMVLVRSDIVIYQALILSAVIRILKAGLQPCLRVTIISSVTF